MAQVPVRETRTFDPYKVDRGFGRRRRHGCGGSGARRKSADLGRLIGCGLIGSASASGGRRECIMGRVARVVVGCGSSGSGRVRGGRACMLGHDQHAAHPSTGDESIAGEMQADRAAGAKVRKESGHGQGGSSARAARATGWSRTQAGGGRWWWWWGTSRRRDLPGAGHRSPPAAPDDELILAGALQHGASVRRTLPPITRRQVDRQHSNIEGPRGPAPSCVAAVHALVSRRGPLSGPPWVAQAERRAASAPGRPADGRGATGTSRPAPHPMRSGSRFPRGAAIPPLDHSMRDETMELFATDLASDPFGASLPAGRRRQIIFRSGQARLAD